MKPKLIEDLGMQYPTEKSKRKARFGMYECLKCKKHFKTQINSVNSGQTKNCKKCKNLTHGLTDHKLYGIWRNEKRRCYDKKTKHYELYGGKGIIVSDEFHNFDIWLKYVESLDNSYINGYTIDRIDNDKNYQRGNLRWASKNTQAQNTVVIQKNNTSGYRGVGKSLNKWRSTIHVNSIKINLGTYDTKIEAAKAYDTYVIDNKTDHNINGV